MQTYNLNKTSIINGIFDIRIINNDSSFIINYCHCYRIEALKNAKPKHL